MADVPSIETCGLGDVAELRSLSQLIGWGHTSEDWRTILEVGRVFGHRAEGGGFASSGALFEFGETLASIGMVLVAPAYRGKGLARAVMRQCLEAVGARPTVLVATAQGEPLYRSIGFVEIERVCRIFIGDGLTGSSLSSITPRDEADVVRLDREAFGADRHAVLGAYLARADATAIVRDVAGGIRGFGMAVRQGGRRVIGPVAAREPEDALALFRSLALGYEGELRIEVPTRQTHALDTLVAFGGRRADDAPVMLYGAPALPGRRDMIYALASRGFG